MNSNNISQNDDPVKPTPTLSEILAAPEDEWRELARQADADPAYCERLRAQQKEQGGQLKATSKRKRRPSGGSRSKRRQSAADAFQATQIGKAMVEAVERVNESEAKEADPPQRYTRRIPLHHWLHGTIMLEV